MITPGITLNDETHGQLIFAVCESFLHYKKKSRKAGLAFTEGAGSYEVITKEKDKRLTNHKKGK